MKLMVPFCLFLYFQGPLAAALQGLDYAHVAMKNSIYGAVIKTVAIYFLATQPSLGSHGITIAISIGIVLVTLLHFFSVVKLTSFSIDLWDILKVMFAMLLMGISAVHLFEAVSPQWSLAKSLLIASFGSSIVYLMVLIWLKILGKQDIQRIPLIGRFMAPFFKFR